MGERADSAKHLCSGRSGQSMSAPGGLRMTLIAVPAETRGRLLEMEWWVPPGDALVAADHYHPDGPEIWSLLEGRAGYRLDGDELYADAPFSYVVRGGTSHGHPWNAGQRPMRVRQKIDTGFVDMPGVVSGVQAYFETVFAFGQRGEVNDEGDIKGRLQNILTTNDLLLGGTYLAGPPRWAQRALLGAIARLAAARGLSAYARPSFDPA